MVTKEEIYSLLSSIPDPEIPVVTIEELGILRGVELNSGEFEVIITPTYSGCPAMSLIEDQIKEKLHTKGVDNFHVKTVYSPAWTTDWMSDEAKEKLRMYGITPPGPVQIEIDDVVECVVCPHCASEKTEPISRFGSTSCKSLYRCNSCLEPFEYFKPH